MACTSSALTVKDMLQSEHWNQYITRSFVQTISLLLDWIDMSEIGEFDI